MSPRIVLVHGLGRDLHDWDAVVPGLTDLAECIAVDLAGFGMEPPQLLRPGSVRRAVTSLRMPVAALYGRHDRLVPVQHAVRFKRLLPAADVRVLQHAGHLVQLEDPGDVVAAVRRQVTAYAGAVVSTPGEGA